MKRTRTGVLAFAAVLTAGLAAQALAAEDFRWQGKLARGNEIEIKGVNGSITATGGTGDEVVVTAVKKAHRSDPASVKVEVVPHAGGVTICAVYPSVEGKPNVCAPGEGGHMSTKDNDVSVDFQVQVPEGVRLSARTVNGAISATGVHADVRANTVNGAVALESTGIATANTVNGAVRVHMGRADWQGTLKLNTVNGSVEVALPADASTEVSAATVNGHVETDFPLTVVGKIVGRSIHGTIGAGGRQLELNTVNGGITLRKAGAAKAER
ncbi:MAG TPA: DUF4097 family beta strand repeat-containing protein [Vicinamibacteria bacterium]|nr:DUF4097 family beta strand repeat-containing protein [Vicinamibacteria bacterium]